MPIPQHPTYNEAVELISAVTNRAVMPNRIGQLESITHDPAGREVRVTINDGQIVLHWTGHNDNTKTYTTVRSARAALNR